MLIEGACFTKCGQYAILKKEHKNLKTSLFFVPLFMLRGLYMDREVSRRGNHIWQIDSPLSRRIFKAGLMNYINDMSRP